MVIKLRAHRFGSGPPISGTLVTTWDSYSILIPKQRYRCQNADCPHQSFLLNPAYKGRLPEIKEQIVNMGYVRDTGNFSANGRPSTKVYFAGQKIGVFKPL
jgi:hypothetical protein